MTVLKKIPKYAIIPSIIIISMQYFIYFGTQLINKHFVAHDFTIAAIDNLIPVATFFIIFYISCYPWWYISPLVVANTNKKRFYNWSLTCIICFMIAGIIFLVIPTTITRPKIENNNIFDWLTNLTYLSDSPERPINLFPSFHVLVSWFCYIGVRNQKNIHLWYRISALIYAILIILSTQFIKQHYIVDLVSAIVLAETVFYIVTRYNLGNMLKNILEKKGE